MSQVTIQQALQLAVQHQQSGRLQEAEAIYRQILAAQPDEPNALYLLATIAQQVGKHHDAVELLKPAAKLMPRDAGVRAALGVALALGPGDLVLAVYELKQAIALDPNFPDGHLNLGNVLNMQGHRADALACFRRALELRPDYVEAHFNLANALLETDIDEAIEHYRKIEQLRPDLPVIHVQLGEALHRQGDNDAAERHLRKAIELDPNLPDPHFSLGVIAQLTGKREESIAHYREAIRLRPDYPSAHHNLGVALRESAPAEELYRHFRQMILANPTQREAADSALHLMHYLADFPADRMFQEHLRWAEVFEKPLLAHKPLCIPPLALDPDQRLRIGFVSRDFRDHSVAYFLEPILEARDRARVEVFLYADEVIDADHVTARLKTLADTYRAVTDLDEAQLAQKIAEDQIDILVDLAGHTDGNRLLTFARRPAPVQVTWLGYPDTTGMASIDFRLTDAHADPVGETDLLHTEKLVRLESAWCYRPPNEAPTVAPELPSDRAGHVTFGCFNVLPKVNPPLIAQWCRLLQAVPNSRMIIKSRGLDREEARKRIAGHFAASGIAGERIELIAATPTLVEHLQLYDRVDVALDTFPYHGTTTTCEALWMGVPVVTLAGRTHASRVGVSLLHSAGVPDLIAKDFDDYIAIATSLASDVDRRRTFRREIRDRLRQSILLDAPRAAAAFESTMRDLWRQRVHSPG